MDVCDKIIMKKISEVKPYVRNPRKNDKTVELLVDIIPKVGFNVPIVIDEKGIIVKGHSRYKAAIKLGLKEVPCIISTAGEEANKLDRIADNRISEFSEWLSEPLMHELDMMNMDFSNLEFAMPTPLEDIPTFDNFEEAFAEEHQEQGVTEEQKQELYKKFLEEQAQQQAPVQMTSQAKIDKAVQKQHSVPEAKKQYVKVVCEHCGHIMFVDANNLWSPSED